MRNLKTLLLVLLTTLAVCAEQTSLAASFVPAEGNNPAKIILNNVLINGNSRTLAVLKAIDKQNISSGQVFELVEVQAEQGDQDATFSASTNMVVIPFLNQSSQLAFSVVMELINTKPFQFRVNALSLAAETAQIVSSANIVVKVNGVAQSGNNIAISKSSIGLSNVDDTSDLNKPISTATQSALATKANLASPNFSGIPSAPTAAAGTSSTQLATTEFVMKAITPGSTNIAATANVKHSLGEAFGGGVVFAVNASGSHGLIAENQDLTASSWYDAQNKISNSSLHSVAAQDYFDWRLPTIYELSLLYSRKNLLTGFSNATYWSSTEVYIFEANGLNFSDGTTASQDKDAHLNLRVVRAF